MAQNGNVNGAAVGQLLVAHGRGSASAALRSAATLLERDSIAVNADYAGMAAELQQRGQELAQREADLDVASENLRKKEKELKAKAALLEAKEAELKTSKDAEKVAQYELKTERRRSAGKDAAAEQLTAANDKLHRELKEAQQDNILLRENADKVKADKEKLAILKHKIKGEFDKLKEERAKLKADKAAYDEMLAKPCQTCASIRQLMNKPNNITSVAEQQLDGHGDQAGQAATEGLPTEGVPANAIPEAGGVKNNSDRDTPEAGGVKDSDGDGGVIPKAANETAEAKTPLLMKSGYGPDGTVLLRRPPIHRFKRVFPKESEDKGDGEKKARPSSSPALLLMHKCEKVIPEVGGVKNSEKKNSEKNSVKKGAVKNSDPVIPKAGAEDMRNICKGGDNVKENICP